MNRCQSGNSSGFSPVMSCPMYGRLQALLFLIRMRSADPVMTDAQGKLRTRLQDFTLKDRSICFWMLA